MLEWHFGESGLGWLAPSLTSFPCYVVWKGDKERELVVVE